MARILSISYDHVLLETRRLLLEASGYSVTSALGLKESMYYCKQGGFDLFILGHSIPHFDKKKLIREFRASCRAPIVSLRSLSEPAVVGANYYVDPDPESVLDLVAQVLGGPEAKLA